MPLALPHTVYPARLSAILTSHWHVSFDVGSGDLGRDSVCMCVFVCGEEVTDGWGVRQRACGPAAGHGSRVLGRRADQEEGLLACLLVYGVPVIQDVYLSMVVLEVGFSYIGSPR